jgi:hypothetical protein
MRLVAALAVVVVIVLVHAAPTLRTPDLPDAARTPAGGGQAGVATASVTGGLPFEVTEIRERCDHYDPNRQPFFGTTHLHTGLSFDASIRFVDYSSGNDPRGAYRFAKGLQSIKLPDPLGFQGPDPLRNPRIDRPSDWGGVTDHSEHFGEIGICKNFLGLNAPGLLSMECRMINGFYYQPGTSLSNLLDRTFASNAFTQLTMMNDGPVTRNTRLPLCVNNPAECAASELAVWTEMQRAAEEEYDRSRHCTFTTFVAYENTSTPSSVNWHRNVFFRNDRVVKRPITAIDMAIRPNDSPTTGGPAGVGRPPNYIADVVPADPDVFPVPPGTVVSHPLPQRLWSRLERECTLGQNITDGLGLRCDFVTIPHNSNLGGGLGLIPPMFMDPFNKEDARRHQKFEPLVEIYQDKGGSECRWDPRFNSGVQTTDEFCSFEILDALSLTTASGVGGSSSSGAVPPQDFDDRAYVRNVWKDGLQQAQQRWDGVNPFKMGVVSSSDSHTGVMGWHPETKDWPGHLGLDDAWPVERASTIQNSSGGHSVVWAEENSRDSIFEALKRKETYGTSGTRIVVRFFGGWNFTAQDCNTNFVPKGYQQGVPMGGDLRGNPGAQRAPKRGNTGGPSFIVAAWKDDFIGTDLEQIQIIKGWVDGNGQTHEKVVRVAGEPGNATNPEVNIDTRTCQPRRGSERLCAVWQDTEFSSSQRAFYYARVLENPVCRYSTHWCRERIGVDPLNLSQCKQDLSAMASSSDPVQREHASRGAACCSNQTTFPFVQPVIQERAWTSPIWYEPQP